MNWRKASYSQGNGDCVELATPRPTTVLVRNSKHPDRGTLVLPAAVIASFVTACKAGELDDLTV